MHVYMCACIHAQICHSICVEVRGLTLGKLVLAFLWLAPCGQTQAVRFSNKRLTC